MSEHLLQLVAAEGERERRLILDRARREGEELVAAAEAKAETLLARTPAPSVGNRGLKALAAGRREVLELYTERILQLHAAAAAHLSRLDATTRHRLSAQVVTSVLAKLDPGVYQLEARAQVWDELTAADSTPPGRHLRWNPGPDNRVRLSGEGDNPLVEFSLESMVGEHIERQAGALAERLLGHELV